MGSMIARRFVFILLILSVSVALFFAWDIAQSAANPHQDKKISTAASFEEWSVETAWTADPTLLSRGIELAKVRREDLKDLIRRDPAAALNEVISLSEYAALPEEIRAYVERPVSAFGNIDLLWATRFDEAGNRICLPENRLYLDGSSYELHGPGRRDEQRPAFGVPVVAYLVDDVALIQESPVLPVSGPELAAAEFLFDQLEGQESDPLTGMPVDEETAAVIGGTVYRFTAPAMIEQVEYELTLAEMQAAEDRSYTVEMPFAWLEAKDGRATTSGITEASYFADDNISVLAIRCDFSDIPGAPVSQLDLETDLAAISGHLNTMSYGTASLTYSVTSTLYQPSGTGTSYAQAGDNDGLYTDVLADYDASPDYLASSSYDVVMIYFPSLSGVTDSLITYGGLASVGGSRHWINGLSTSTSRIEVITHEFGHNYGLFHSNYYHPEKGISGSYYGDSLEYGDIFDLMGQGDITDPLNPAHFNMYQKNAIDWLPEVNIADITLDGTYRVYRFDDINALDNPVLALRIPMGGGVTYWVGYRQLYTSVPNFVNGIYVVADGLEPVRPERPTLVDMTPGSSSPETADRLDAGLAVGNFLYDSTSGVTFTPVATGTDGTGDEWIDVTIAFDPRVGFAATDFEFDEARGVASVTVRRSFGGTGALTLDYATADGSAVAGSDYSAASGSLSWADGDTSDKIITIAILPDALSEGIEDFSVTISNPSIGTIPAGEGTATVSILDAGQRFASFTPGFFNNSVYAIDFQSDGRPIIGGTIGHTSGEFEGAGNIARLSLTGSVDTSFNNSGTGFNNRVRCIVVQDDDKILVGGDFTTYNGTPANRLIRLNSNGSIDTTFLSNIGTGFDNSIHTIAIQQDGEILVGGDFGDFNGVLTSNLGLVRLASDGNPGAGLALPFDTGFGARIKEIIVEPNGDILVIGSFYIGWTGSGFRSGIARLNIDGSRDVGFDPDGGLHADTVVSSLRTGYAMGISPDGDIIVGGSFSAYDENSAENFARVNTNGTFDSTLASPLNSLIRTVLVEPFGGVLFGGEFNSPDSRLMRVDSSLSHDTAFTSSGGPSSRVYTLVHGPDGSLWVGGNFFGYNGTSSRPIVRLASGVSPYEFWAGETFTRAQIAAGLADPDFDLDGDGFDNITELALGTDPKFADAYLVYANNLMGSFEPIDSGGSDYLQISVDKASAEGGLWYVAQVSSDLVNWSPNPAVPGNHPALEILEDTADRLTVRDATPLLPGAPRFIRLVFKKPE
ncbi:hypothetical protein G0Q06_04060 [Puniceicoccales bacterium CK1056]|uniref:Calx-beta domain-containing protein n=1 Tax=Oceanipulchritudo coccoides TaxID=2706888 RepID=A0A6B2M0Q5_9BACT|nr:Calx-beta domain-containing protein [Oceanipulchritudo coccoides]NDV61617.1 hypothetical protein [Oceanipulchritudo coccoides]